MADDAIAHMKMLNAVDPEKPFFVYYVPGGTHAPHHPTPEWIKKISDMHLFDKGWNELREQIFANQKKLGVIPPDAKLTAWPDELKKWDTLTPDEKKLFIRQVDVYAAYLAYTDHEIGRVIQAVEDMGKLDNTLIIYISGDNGSSAEGSPNGTPSEVAQFNGVEVPVADQLKYFYDAMGLGQNLQPHGGGLDLGLRHAVQVDQANGVALRRHAAGHGRGLAGAHQRRRRHSPPVPSRHRHRADDPRGDRHSAPVMVDGIAQKPIEGVSMAYTWDRANANAPIHAPDPVLRDVRQPWASITTAGMQTHVRSTRRGTLPPRSPRTS